MLKIIKIFILLVLLAQNGFAQTNQTLINKFRLAQSYEHSGNISKAAEMYNELLKIQPWNMQYFQALNNLHLGQKDYESSILLLEKQIKNSPDDLSLHGMLGSTYYISGNSAKAFEIWESAIRRNPENIIGYKVISNYAIENRAFDKAIEYLNAGKEFSKDPKIFSFDLANIYSITMQFSEAAAEYCNLLKFYPEQLTTIKNRITRYLNTEDASTRTLEAVNKYVEDDSSIVFLDLLSFLQMQIKDFPASLKTAIILDRIKNDNGATFYNLTQNFYKEKAYAVSADAYRRILEMYPNSVFAPKAKIGYAHSLKAALDYENSTNAQSWLPVNVIDTTFAYKYGPIIRTFENIIAAHPNSETANTALLEIGIIYLDKFDNLNSADSIFRFLSNQSILAKTRPPANEQLGKINVMRGNLAAAEEYYQKIIRNSRADASFKIGANFMLAKIAFWEMNFSKSLKLLNEILNDLSHDFANDALEMSVILNTLKSDSINLSIYSKASFLAEQRKFTEAAEYYKQLSNNPNVLLLSNLAKYKYAEIQLALNNLPLAIELLKQISENETKSMFSDRALYLLANTYLYGKKEQENALKTFEKLLELFPNSLYFDKSRQIINVISIKENEKI